MSRIPKHTFIPYDIGPYVGLDMCKGCGHPRDSSHHTVAKWLRTPTIRELLAMPTVPRQAKLVVEARLTEAARRLYGTRNSDIPRALAVASFLYSLQDRS